MSLTTSVTDNTALQRFELEVEGLVVFCEYRRDADRIALTHVESPLELRGKGAAGDLMAGIMALAEAQDLKIVPLCSYAVAWMKRHPEFDHLRA